MNGPNRKRIVFIANCVYGDHVAGGDIHFFQMAQAAMDAGYRVHFFGGHALQKHLRSRFKEFELTLTDQSQRGPFAASSLKGQFQLLFDYWRRFVGTLRQLSKIGPEDTVYAVTDYWFDVWPAVLSRAAAKLMILGMDAPTLREIVFRLRADVTASRINSVYYWVSQNLSLQLFRFCEHKTLFYVHPAMKERLLLLGYGESELVFVSNGMDLKIAEKVPAQKKEFDVIWLGRLHRQKGIDDLLQTLVTLSKQLKDFRAVLVGNLNELAPRIAELGLTQYVTLSGLVSESEKFRLFKASRVFLMPSRQESWGIVIAESIACDTPVVAYDLPAYHAIFDGLVDYVPCFNSELFARKSLDVIESARRDDSSFDAEKLARFKAGNSWQAAGKRFVSALEAIEDISPSALK